MFANERGVDTLDRPMYSLIIPFLPSLYITQDHFTDQSMEHSSFVRTRAKIESETGICLV